MRIASVQTEQGGQAAVVDPARGVALASRVAPGLTGDLMELIATGATSLLSEQARSAGGAFQPAESVTFTAPYRNPAKIWGIGLNYRAHASDMKSALPSEPASFIKANHTIIGPGDDIVLPPPDLAGRVTAEAELGLVIGRYCRNVSEEDALGYLWGVTPVLDQTAEDLVIRNPRFLTRSKNFPTFFSFGPVIVPVREVLETFGSLDGIEVRTVKNGTVAHADAVRSMTFSPARLISFHSRIMPLYPGDIISPGTPGAAPVSDGDVVCCEIPGIGTLRNPVRASPGG